jgi:hypothetical protein
VATVENGSKSASRWQWAYQDIVHDIVNNLARFTRVHLMIYRIDRFIIAIVLISIKIFNTTTVTAVVEKEAIVSKRSCH